MYEYLDILQNQWIDISNLLFTKSLLWLMIFVLSIIMPNVKWKITLQTNIKFKCNRYLQSHLCHDNA